MIKCIILNGIPVVMDAFVSLAKQKKSEIKTILLRARIGKPMKQTMSAASLSSKRCIGMTTQRYGHRSVLTKTFVSTFPLTNDFSFQAYLGHLAWISTDISYGLFLADHSVLDIAESELVILPAIMCQNLAPSTKWHLRGCLRVGLTREEVESIQQCVERIAAACGKELKGLPRVCEIPDEDI